MKKKESKLRKQLERDVKNQDIPIILQLKIY